MIILLLLLYIIWIANSQIKTQIQQPTQVSRELVFIQQYAKGDSIQLQFNHIHSFSSSFYQRQHSINPYSINDDYAKYPMRYSPNTICRLIPTEVDLHKMINKTINFNIKDITVDFINKTIYILSDQQQIFKLGFKIDHDNIVLDSEPQRLKKAAQEQYFVSIYYYEILSSLYIIGKNWIYQLVLQDNHFYSIVSYTTKNISKIQLFSERIAILSSQNHITIYKIVNKSQIILQTQITSFKGNPIQIIDIWMDSKQILALTNTSLCIFTFQNREYTDNTMIQINYGRNKQIQKSGSTIHLVFQLNNFTYIAEFVYLNNTLNLNRFYDTIHNIQSFTILNDLMIIVGDEQMLITRHSINHHLLQQKIDSYIYFPSFNQSKLQLPKLLNYQQSTISIAYNTNTIYFSKFKRTNTKLSCDMMNKQFQYSIYVELKTTLCMESVFQNPIDINRYCIIKVALQLQQVNLHDRKTSNLISLALSLIVILIVIVVLGLTYHLKDKRDFQINKLSKILQKKQNKKTNQNIYNPTSKLILANQQSY